MKSSKVVPASAASAGVPAEEAEEEKQWESSSERSSLPLSPANNYCGLVIGVRRLSALFK